MEEDQLSSELENLLERYRQKVSQLRMDAPRRETLPSPEKPEPWTRPAPPRAAEPPPSGIPKREFIPAWKRGVRSFKPAARWGAAAAALALALAFIWRLHPFASGPLHRAFAIPYDDTAGLALEGRKLFSLDKGRQLLFSFGAEDGQVKSVSPFAAPSSDSLAWGDGYFWSSDAGGGAIYQHNDDANHTVRRAFSIPNLNPTGISWDGRYLWARDFRTDTLNQYAVTDTLVPIKQYTLEGVSFGGMQIAGNILWVCDKFRHKVRRYHMGERLSPLDLAALDPWLPKKSVVAGCAVTPAALWIATTKPAELHRFDLKKIPWQDQTSGLLKE